VPSYRFKRPPEPPFAAHSCLNADMQASAVAWRRLPADGSKSADVCV
jgi:hypothetical protein